MTRLLPTRELSTSSLERNHSTAFDAAVPTSLFQASRLLRRSALLGGDRYYAVSPRGDRFLVNQSTSDLRASAITIVIDR